MRYDIEADWQLLNTCNYRCEYCFFPPTTLGEKLIVHADPDAWKAAFDRTGITWLLHITGGEPTIYPGFPELAQVLTSTHYLSFNSNLSHPSVLDFAQRVDPGRVNFINAGLHADERQRRKGLAAFLKHAERLKEKKFSLFVSIVATPEVLSRVDEIVALTAPIGIVPVPKILRTSYKGKSYPRSYSEAERRAFIEFGAKAREAYGPFGTVTGQRPSIDVFGDEKYLEGFPRFRGRMCSAGQKFVRLEPDGGAFRCQEKRTNYLGNVLHGPFNRMNVKAACDSDYCIYFCAKYSEVNQARRSRVVVPSRTVDRPSPAPN
jgi:MoaA/NifB/PqqE/SkfB family radical SAM enzyme